MEKMTILPLEAMLARRLLLANEMSAKAAERRGVCGELCRSTESLLLDELLEDIRRSRASSTASTPTKASPDLRVNECTVNSYTAAELEDCEEAFLKSRLENLESEVESQSKLLVRLLHTRDLQVARLSKNYEKLTEALKEIARDTGMSDDLIFSIKAPPGSADQRQWLNAWKALVRIGIPKHWRKTLWSTLAHRGTASVDWEAILPNLFSETVRPEDEQLGAQIVKDLYRTGNAGFATEEEHAILKRVLLAYARYNKSTGYCQGFNIMAAMILKIVNFDEQLALKVMVLLIDFTIPENYFAQNLYALSADMMVVKELMKLHLPDLYAHMEKLRQKEVRSRTSYSSEDTPAVSAPAYEPPLADVFTVQWFLTLFSISLPTKLVKKVWDAIFVEGSEMMVFAALAIWEMMESKLLLMETASDFYVAMSDQKVKEHIQSTKNFIQAVYEVRNALSTIKAPTVQQLRDKYTYNVCPCPPDDDSVKKCPPPTRGGAFGAQEKPSTLPFPSSPDAKDLDEGSTVSMKDRPLHEQIKLLQQRYSKVTRTPKKITYELGIGMAPMARASCPQSRKHNVSAGYSAYAADVPLVVLKSTAVTPTVDGLGTRPFTLMYSQPAVVDLPLVIGDKTSRHTSVFHLK